MKNLAQTISWTILSLAAPLLSAQAVAADHKPASHSRREDPFLNGAPFTFEQAMRLSSEDAIPLRRRKEAIQNRGVDFALTSDMVDKLKAAGAPTELIETIKSKARVAPPPAPAPPPKPADGGLALRCDPAECQVGLNNQPRGTTKSGALEIPKLAPGKWVVDVLKDGYIGKQLNVTIEPGKTAAASVVLEPSRATQESWGAGLFRRILQAVGAENGTQALASIQAVGSATIWRADGTNLRWTLWMRNKLDRALFQVAGGGGILREVAFLGSEYKTSRNLRGDEALEWSTNFGLVRDHQLAVLLSKLSGPQCKLLARHPQPLAGEEYSLFAENGTEKIDIGLDDTLRPQRVRITSEAGVGSVTVSYSDYQKIEKISYPRSMQVKSGNSEQGIEVRLDRVFLSPNLTDGDYKLKGKPFAKLQN